MSMLRRIGILLGEGDKKHPSPRIGRVLGGGDHKNPGPDVGRALGDGDRKSLGPGIRRVLGGGDRQNPSPAYLSAIVGSGCSLEKTVSITSKIAKERCKFPLPKTCALKFQTLAFATLWPSLLLTMVSDLTGEREKSVARLLQVVALSRPWFWVNPQGLCLFRFLSECSCDGG
ncbi:hypothetical protein AMTR_s00206p00029970 [Amborella trichopoda]|uniref:Uncharacterized protein n=1 Tax=Amborella trichopoda TaxID=13333 RepID=W1P5V8_AMBTC|nr:hypothetical protein AMTR_s00206p00029970 [Amborella trichopoda]